MADVVTRLRTDAIALLTVSSAAAASRRTALVQQILTPESESTIAAWAS